MKHSWCIFLAVASLALHPVADGGQQPRDYKPQARVTGTIRVWGSPQMQDLLALDEKGFIRLQPDVQFKNELKSTLAAVPGVYTGRADIGLLGREIWPAEAQAFEAVLGRKPLVIEIATGSYDVPKATYALMIFVNAKNPIRSLSMEQLNRIFGAGARHIGTWGEVGGKGRWARQTIHLYGFSTDNDKAQIFGRLVFHGDQLWAGDLHQFRNSSGPDADAGTQIVQAVATDPYGIGISNVHYAVPGVKALALSTAAQPQPIAPSRQNVETRAYPLTRAVYMVVDREAFRDNPAVLEFLRYVVSQQGSDAVQKQGEYLPLPSEVAARQLRELARQ